MAFRVVVLGGYGHYGGRIAQSLAGDDNMGVVVAGRDAARAAEVAAAIARECGKRVEFAAIDVLSAEFLPRLRQLDPSLVVHAGGPFLGRDHAVARAALSAGAHYVDLADARAFVCGIRAIDDAARARDRLVVSGASSAPGMSSAVVDAFAHEFDALTSIDFGISAGNQMPQGSATVAAVTSYVGKAFGVWRDGAWKPAYGWQHLRRYRYPPAVGTRWLADCDAPDLELFPDRYPGVQSVRFGAGLELPILHFGMWLLSWPTRWNWIQRLDAHAGGLRKAADLFRTRGSDAGAMHVCLRGYRRSRALTITWTLVAGQGDGPQLPSTPAIVLARKLAAGTLAARGAMPCLGLFSLDEAMRALDRFDVRATIERTLG